MIKFFQDVHFKQVDLEGFTVEDPTILSIEGYASVFADSTGEKVIDRDNEIVSVAGMELDSYQKNPILLYNHDYNKPIGRVTAASKTPEGLYIQAEVHKLSGLEGAFEAVQKNLIQSLSIGFQAQKYTYLEDEDAFEISKSTLHEISLAPVQSNQLALFEVTGTKALKTTAQAIAEQNDITLCELKGLCKLPQEKEKTVEKTEEELAVQEAEAAKIVQQEADKLAATEAEAAKIAEEEAAKVAEEAAKDKETPSNVNIDMDALAGAIQAAKDKADELAAAKVAEDEAAKVAEETAATEAKVQQSTDALNYLRTRKEEIAVLDIENLDTDDLDELYETTTELVEAIESKVVEAIQAATDTAA